ncbi:hypothetical protein SUGI_0237980 [Cryptomeria japonica]|nr:hypothetical protein SUGI_0237980 [Cryptomeria japonica]
MSVLSLNGFTFTDLVALSGGHTIGRASYKIPFSTRHLQSNFASLVPQTQPLRPPIWIFAAQMCSTPNITWTF